MHLDTAINLAKKLSIGHLHAAHRCYAYVADGRIYFAGNQQKHSLDIGVSSEERVLAHWGGYVGSDVFGFEVQS